MMLEFTNPIPVLTPLGDGYAIYATHSGQFDNDTWTVCLCSDGSIRHFNTGQVKMWANATFGINGASSKDLKSSEVNEPLP